MHLGLTEEQRMIRQTAREFAESELAGDADERDRQQRFPEDHIKKLAELGFMGMMVSEEYGGAGLDTVSYVLAVEELSRVDASTGVIVSVNNSLVCHGIEHFGTEEQKQKYLVPLARGQQLGAYCLSEPGTGSDAAALQTMAVEKGDHWILNGTKNFITNGVHANTYIVFATIDRALGHRGVTAFLVERTFPGFRVGKKEEKLGIRSSDTASIILEDCQVPKENVLGEVGKGFRIAMNILDGGRIGIAAQAVGIAQGALDTSIKYAQEREQFGRPLAKFQAIQFMLADMEIRIHASRLLTFDAAWRKDQDQPYTAAASKAKVFASETAVWCGTKAVQIHGGYGYLKDYPVERFMRDAKITEIYEGTSEIQRLVVARSLLQP